jgi:TonB system transport protein ExbD (group 1)
MAAKLSGGGGSSKFLIEQNNEINVTPFVDVMLVLLIIFMVAAPLAAPEIQVDLPPALARAQQNPPKPIYIFIQADGKTYLGSYPVAINNLTTELNKTAGNSRDQRIFIRADKKVRYGTFMQVMNKLQDDGYYSVALVGRDTGNEGK